MNKEIFAAAVFFASLSVFPTVSFAQDETKNELEKREYEIIGKDTRTFKITGDKVSAIDFINFPVALPQEERSRETSKGLIRNEERLFRKDISQSETGHFAYADISAGSNTYLDFWGKASLNRNNRALSIGLISRYARENTPANISPVINSFDATGSLGRADGSISAKIGFINETDISGKSDFRLNDSSAERFFGMSEIKKNLLDNLELVGNVDMRRGSFKDETIGYKKDEIDFKSNAELSSEIFDIDITSSSMLRYMKMGSSKNTLFKTGLHGDAQVLENISIGTGIDFYHYDPDTKQADFQIAPSARFNWDIFENMAVGFTYNPEVKSFSFGDIHDINGLVLPNGGLLKKEINDMEADLTVRIREKITVSPGIKYTNTINALVFTRNSITFSGGAKKMDFFDIVPDAHTKITTYSVKTSLTPKGKWGIDGDFAFNDGEWNKDGNIPFLSDFELGGHGFVSPFEKWTFHCLMRVFGKHFVETGSDDKIDPFVKIDLKAETVLSKYLDMNFELRNITNSRGFWWTEHYRIPGIGIYAGLSAKY